MADFCFEAERVSRYIALGKPKNEIVPLFAPLIRGIIRSVSFDPRNFDENDLTQFGLIKAAEVIAKFDPARGNLFFYATKVIKQAIWSEVRLRPGDYQRSSDDIDPDTHAAVPEYGPLANATPQDELVMDSNLLKNLRLEDDSYQPAARYIFGVLLANDYESNRARVLKTLTHGYDVNPKYARYLADHVLVSLRVYYSKGALEVREDQLFANKFKYTLVPEIRELIGERAFERLIHFFGGLTISVPSMDFIRSIDRDLAILKALTHDWNCGPNLAKKYRISPEGIKAVYKASLHKLHTDPEYRDLVAAQLDLDKIPGYENPEKAKKMKKPLPSFGEKRIPPRRKVSNTDSMGFTLGSRNSLLYTLIVAGHCSRKDLVSLVMEKFGGLESAAKATVSAFLSDIKHPFGKFNTSRNLRIVVDPKNHMTFTKESLAVAQAIIAEKRQAQMIAEVD